MAIWKDNGIVLSERKHGENYKIIDIFTHSHGIISSLANVSKFQRFAKLSSVKIEHISKDNFSIGFWKLLDEKQNYIYVIKSEKRMIVCQGICFALKKTLPQGVPHTRLFAFVEDFITSIDDFSDKDVLTLYAYFEFLLLEETGYSVVLNNNSPKLWNSWKNGKIFAERTVECIKNSLNQTGVNLSKHLISIDNYFRSLIIKSIA